jgi:hypothetical protein
LYKKSFNKNKSRMEASSRIKKGNETVPFQEFEGKKYFLYRNERYFSKGGKRLHVEVWKFYNGEVPKNYHVHHKDGNTWNNEISNLDCIEAFKHLSEHAKQNVINNPEWFKEFLKRGIAAAPKWHKSPEGIEWHRQHANKCNFGNQTYGETNCLVCSIVFIKNTNSAKFCSNKCKSADRRNRGVDNIEKECIVCKSKFIKSKYDIAKCCSGKCGRIKSRTSL